MLINTQYLGDDVTAVFEDGALCLQIDGVPGSEIYLTLDAWSTLLQFMFETRALASLEYSRSVAQ